MYDPECARARWEIEPTSTTSPLECSTSCECPTPVGTGHPLGLVVLDVDRDAGVLEQIGDSLDRVPHHGTAHMVGVRMCDEHAR